MKKTSALTKQRLALLVISFAILLVMIINSENMTDFQFRLGYSLSMLFFPLFFLAGAVHQFKNKNTRQFILDIIGTIIVLLSIIFLFSSIF